MTLGVYAAALCLSVLTAFSAGQEDYWSQWRGPLGTGAAPKANPPLTWSSTQNIKWKLAIPGRGTGTPIVWGNQVFVQTAIPVEKKVAAWPAIQPSLVLAAQQPQPGQGRQRGGGGGPPRNEKPSQEQQFVILSIDRQSGKIQWQQTARQEVPHEGHHQDHTFASASPITDGEHLFAYFGSRGLYAYDQIGRAHV